MTNLEEILPEPKQEQGTFEVKGESDERYKKISHDLVMYAAFLAPLAMFFIIGYLITRDVVMSVGITIGLTIAMVVIIAIGYSYIKYKGGGVVKTGKLKKPDVGIRGKR